MKYILTIAIAAVALGGCAQPTPIAASPEVVAKCGPPPTRAWYGETHAGYQQRQAVYALCARDDPSYPAALAASIQGRRSADDLSGVQARLNQIESDNQMRDQANFLDQQQNAFWNMVGAMNSLPH